MHLAVAIPNRQLNDNNQEIEYAVGIPASLRGQAIILFEQAFGVKLGLANPNDEGRHQLLTKALHLDYAIAAIRHDGLVGLAGFKTDDGAFTGGISYRRLIDNLGVIQGNRAAWVLSLYARKPIPGELVMDGIAVHKDVRGCGVGGRLLSELRKHAVANGYDQIRLDVIDTNRAARRLYERNGFVASETRTFEYLRWLLGFGNSTTMIQHLRGASID